MHLSKFEKNKADGKVPFDGPIIQYFQSRPVKPVGRNPKTSEESKNTNKTNSKKVEEKSCIFCNEPFTCVAEHKPVCRGTKAVCSQCGETGHLQVACKIHRKGPERFRRNNARRSNGKSSDNGQKRENEGSDPSVH